MKYQINDAEVDCDLHNIEDEEQATAFFKGGDENSTEASIDLFLLDMNLSRRGGEHVLRCLRSTDRYADAQTSCGHGVRKAAVHARKSGVPSFQGEPDFSWVGEYGRG